MSLRELEEEKNAGPGGGRPGRNVRRAAAWTSRAGAAVRGKRFVKFRPYSGQGIEYNQLTV
ncbi:hypothetical protein GCM10028822_23050 [Hymenobacter terrigena]